MNAHPPIGSTSLRSARADATPSRCSPRSAPSAARGERGPLASPHTYPRKPRRLPQIFQKMAAPLYFVTVVTRNRRSLLANSAVYAAFCHYAEANAAQGRAVGRYVIMPDHIHMFVRLAPENDLSTFVRLLKQVITKTLRQTGANAEPFWQDGFFDHVLRNSESYAEKWAYVRENPVRAGLVSAVDEWPYQGKAVSIERP